MMKVYHAIAAVQGELAKTGIAKDGVNESQKYKFRGIDQVYGALSPLLAKHGLCVLPRIIEREMHERVTIKEWQGQKKESVLFYVTVTAEFDFVAVEDGSKHTVRTYGEAMDSGDKATNKAMSAAYKYAAFMAFAIPTEGDNDADGSTHDIQPRHEAEPPRQARTVLDGPYTSPTALKSAYHQLERDLREAESGEELERELEKPGNIAIIEQMKRDAKGYVYGSDKLPENHVPLMALISRLRTELMAQDEAAEREGGIHNLRDAGGQRVPITAAG